MAVRTVGRTGHRVVPGGGSRLLSFRVSSSRYCRESLRCLHLAGVVDEAAGLTAPHGGVAAVAGDQLAVGALLDDAAVLEHD